MTIRILLISQCENITAKHTQANPNPADADETAEAIISEYIQREGVTLEHREGDTAFYQPMEDRIVLPMLNQFSETAECYSTAFHEMYRKRQMIQRQQFS